jgi:uncharacterized membrane protein YqaE (UPF0057 family)
MAGQPGVAAVIAAILLPPLGIFLARGLGPEFWIGTLLTILFWIPGILFSGYRVSSSRWLWCCARRCSLAPEPGYR